MNFYVLDIGWHVIEFSWAAHIFFLKFDNFYIFRLYFVKNVSLIVGLKRNVLLIILLIYNWILIFLKSHRVKQFPFAPTSRDLLNHQKITGNSTLKYFYRHLLSHAINQWKDVNIPTQLTPLVAKEDVESHYFRTIVDTTNIKSISRDQTD